MSASLQKLCVSTLAMLAMHCSGGNGFTDTGPNGGDATADVDAAPAATWRSVVSRTANPIQAIWASGPHDVYAITFREILRYQGVTWAIQDPVAMPEYVYSTIAGSTATDVWLLGITIPPNGSADMGMTVFGHSDGSGWGYSPQGGSTVQYTSLFARTNTDGWAVGPASAVLHRDTAVSAQWTRATTGLDGSDLIAVWAAGPTDVFAVGAHLWHWDGSTWTQTGSCLTNPCEYYTSIWGASSSDVWIAGNYGYVQHWNGSTWSPFDQGTAADGITIRAVWGSSSSDVWFVGDSNFMSHWDGHAFTQIQLPAGTTNSTTNLTAVGGSGPLDVWVGGSGGKIIHYSP